LIKQAGQKAFGEHELRQCGQFDLIAEAPGARRLLPQQERVEETFDLPRIALRPARQNRADLVAEHQGVVPLARVVSKRRGNRSGVEWRVLPGPLQSFPRSLDKFAIAFVVV